MANRRTNSTRQGWESVVARLSRKSSGEKKEIGAGHSSAVESGKPRRAKSLGSGLELEFDLALRSEGLFGFVREHRFHPDRRWRFDFAWEGLKVAVEIEGGVWSGGRHTRGSGFEADCEKYNEAARLGWAVYRFTGKMIKSGYAINLMREVMNGYRPEQGSRLLTAKRA